MTQDNKRNPFRVVALPVRRISATGISEFKECRRRWYYSNESQLNLEPKRGTVAYDFGRKIHHALERHYRDGVHASDAFVEVFDSDVTRMVEVGMMGDDYSKYEAMRELGVQMLTYYENWASTHDDFKMLHTEFEFEIPLVDYDGTDLGVYFVGRIDGIVRTNDGLYYLIEYKTAGTHLASDVMLLDEQTARYQLAAQWLIRNGKVPGIPSDAILSGVIYTALLKKIVKPPLLLKNGKGLSKDIVTNPTTYELYLKAIQDNGFNESDYAAVLDKLQNTYPTGTIFVRREYVLRSKDEMQGHAHRLMLEVREMSRENLPIYPSPKWDGSCAWSCPYHALCVTENITGNLGGEVDFRIRNEFVQRPPRGGVYQQPREGGYDGQELG